MDHLITRNGSTAVLKLDGQFTASDRPAFGQLLADLFQGGAREVEVDMKNLGYMDSVGLGLLITLRDEAEKKGATVALVSPQGEVRSLLEMACFDRLFAIR